MTELLVAVLTAIPLGVGAAWGSRVGGRRLLKRIFALALASALGIGAAWLGYRCQSYWPAGLVTPLFGGLLLAACCWQFFRAKMTTSTPIDSVDRAIGTALGGACGLSGAVMLWLTMHLIVGLSPRAPRVDQIRAEASQQTEAWSHALVRIAHHGFVRHLPLAGELGDELEAVAYILQTPLERRQEYARYKRWDVLADLPTFRAIAENEQLLDEFDRVGNGNLAALYRLQRHPQVLAFVEEEPLQAMISELRATDVAEELAQLGDHVD